MPNAESLEIIDGSDIIKAEGLSVESANTIKSSFKPLFSQAGEILAKSRSVVVTDASQKQAIKQAREFRLALKNIRVSGDKAHKDLKAEYLRTGRAIDGFRNILISLTKGEEDRLQAQEDFAERQEAARKQALKEEREAALRPYGVDTAFYALADMPAESFAQLLESSRITHEAKIEAARKAEAERIAREQAEAAERERIREENARLRREAAEREAAAKVEAERLAKIRAEAEAALRAEREAAAAEQRKRDEAARKEREAIEAKARAEREAAEAQARKEREAREKLEAELKAKQAAEAAKAERERRAAARAARAPDADKIRVLANQIRGIATPSVTTNEAAQTVAKIKDQISKFAAWLEAEATKLEETHNA